MENLGSQQQRISQHFRDLEPVICYSQCCLNSPSFNLFFWGWSGLVPRPWITPTHPAFFGSTKHLQAAKHRIEKSSQDKTLALSADTTRLDCTKGWWWGTAPMGLLWNKLSYHNKFASLCNGKRSFCNLLFSKDFPCYAIIILRQSCTLCHPHSSKIK